MNLANFATVVDGTMFLLGILSFFWAQEIGGTITLIVDLQK